MLLTKNRIVLVSGNNGLLPMRMPSEFVACAIALN
jgi:hypothetical protein